MQELTATASRLGLTVVLEPELHADAAVIDGALLIRSDGPAVLVRDRLSRALAKLAGMVPPPREGDDSRLS